ncbi:Effector protein hopD2 [Aquicella siphonis]|uniref:Effector protein hopD2 n=1 Tax=Aquicella siphonis TaxID=254247 RepID=A0A5E4PLE1_9COXI|nr:tyrosine protein phosphatase [Aquicella siphonis]VVC77231.1 Effector protein hopD2 [Aquicella siphonis]
MKIIPLLATLASAFAIANHAYALNSDFCDGTREHPCIVQDTDKSTSDVKHWRTVKMIRDAYKGNTSGLKHAWVSASGAPSAKGFKKIASNIEKETGGKYKKMIDLDLREEDHAYLNNNAITLTDEHNWINLGNSYQQSIAAEQGWLQSLAGRSVINNVLSIDQFDEHKFSQGVNVKVDTLESEKSVAEKAGFEYIRLTVTDHMAPRDEDVDRFVSLVKSLPDNVWLHMHCRGGNGRATTFMAMYDMLKNADKISFNEIIKRQASVSPYYDLTDIERKHPDMQQYYKARLDFLMHFYQYASTSLRGYSGAWSTWIKEHPLS